MRRFLRPAWLLRHAIAVVLVAGCLALGWWQIGRARGGNALSYGYAIEWPVFALFVIFVWSREVRAERRGGYADPAPPSSVPDDLRIELPTRPAPAPVPPDDDPRSHAYNEYLAWLSAHPEARPGDWPGPAVGPAAGPAAGVGETTGAGETTSNASGTRSAPPGC